MPLSPRRLLAGSSAATLLLPAAQASDALQSLARRPLSAGGDLATYGAALGEASVVLACFTAATMIAVSAARRRDDRDADRRSASPLGAASRDIRALGMTAPSVVARATRTLAAATVVLGFASVLLASPALAVAFAWLMTVSYGAAHVAFELAWRSPACRQWLERHAGEPQRVSPGSEHEPEP